MKRENKNKLAMKERKKEERQLSSKKNSAYKNKEMEEQGKEKEQNL